jgi:hypothetical protein
MKKIIISLTLVLMLCCGVFVGAGCGGNKDQTKQSYGYSAATAATIISTMKKDAPASLMSTSTDEELINKMNDYMGMVESMLADDAFSMKNVESDRPEYNFKSIVSTGTLVGERTRYEMFYNETTVREENEPGEYERTARIEGVLVIDGTDYAIIGESESESEPGETEYSTTFKVALSANKYMIVEHESENEHNEREESYTYKIYENGRVIASTSFEVENEGGEREITLITNQNGVTDRFYMKSVKIGGIEKIQIRVGNNTTTERFTVTITENPDGTYNYDYAFGGGNKLMPRA